MGFHLRAVPFLDGVYDGGCGDTTAGGRYRRAVVQCRSARSFDRTTPSAAPRAFSTFGDDQTVQQSGHRPSEISRSHIRTPRARARRHPWPRSIHRPPTWRKTTRAHRDPPASIGTRSRRRRPPSWRERNGKRRRRSRKDHRKSPSTRPRGIRLGPRPRPRSAASAMRCGRRRMRGARRTPRISPPSTSSAKASSPPRCPSPPPISAKTKTPSTSKAPATASLPSIQTYDAPSCSSKTALDAKSRWTASSSRSPRRSGTASTAQWPS